jgi:ribosomal protein S18 acetylase RimI-like enzyme
VRVDFRRGSIADAKRIAVLLTKPERITYVAESQGHVVAFVDAFLTLSAVGVRHWEVDLLAVHPDFQRRGFACQLIDIITSSGQDMGAVLTRALVHVDNQASQATL